MRIRGTVVLVKPMERNAESLARTEAELRLYRWYLVVQREALGLFRHEEVDRHDAPPEPLPSHP